MHVSVQHHILQWVGTKGCPWVCKASAVRLLMGYRVKPDCIFWLARSASDASKSTVEESLV